MKKVVLIALLVFLGSGNVFANGPFGYPILETTDQARARHSAENYRTYQNNNYNPPLGGYSSNKLGDPQPQGTLQPGYVNNGLNNNNNYGNSYSNSGLNYR